MKKSNKLILSLILFVFLSVVGANLVLKAEYEKIDFEDPFYGYLHEALPSFKVVQLKGNYPGFVQVQPSDDFEIKVSEGLTAYVSWQMQGDTLELTYNRESKLPKHNLEEVFSHLPIAFILAPSIRALYANELSSKITGWDENDIVLGQEGSESTMLLSYNTFKNVEVLVTSGGLLKIATDNTIQNATLLAQNSGSLDVARDIFSTVSIKTDSTAYINLPGALFNKLKK